MKNADMPAMPLSGDAYQDFAHYNGTKDTSYNPECQGLTKREMFAMHIAQGLSSACESSGEWSHDAWTVAEVAVRYADALLSKLEKTNG